MLLTQKKCSQFTCKHAKIFFSQYKDLTDKEFKFQTNQNEPIETPRN